MGDFAVRKMCSLNSTSSGAANEQLVIGHPDSPSLDLSLFHLVHNIDSIHRFLPVFIGHDSVSCPDFNPGPVSSKL